MLPFLFITVYAFFVIVLFFIKLYMYGVRFRFIAGRIDFMYAECCCIGKHGKLRTVIINAAIK